MVWSPFGITLFYCNYEEIKIKQKARIYFWSSNRLAVDRFLKCKSRKRTPDTVTIMSWLKSIKEDYGHDNRPKTRYDISAAQNLINGFWINTWWESNWRWYCYQSVVSTCMHRQVHVCLHKYEPIHIHANTHTCKCKERKQLNGNIVFSDILPSWPKNIIYREYTCKHAQKNMKNQK